MTTIEMHKYDALLENYRQVTAALERTRQHAEELGFGVLSGEKIVTEYGPEVSHTAEAICDAMSSYVLDYSTAVRALFEELRIAVENSPDADWCYRASQVMDSVGWAVQ